MNSPNYIGGSLAILVKLNLWKGLDSIMIWSNNMHKSFCLHDSTQQDAQIILSSWLYLGLRDLHFLKFCLIYERSEVY